MDNKSLLPTIPCVKLVSTNPEKPDIHFSREPNQDAISTQWRISQNQDGETLIKNLSASSLSIDDISLQINQERRLSGGERIRFGENQGAPSGTRSHYIFYLEDVQSDIKKERDETLQKLFKIENDLQKELTCSICANFLSKCMILTPCQHSLCSFCLFDYLKLSNECPLCRVEAVSVTKNPVLSNLIEIEKKKFKFEKFQTL